jgi:hypothetical protein
VTCFTYEFYDILCILRKPCWVEFNSILGIGVAETLASRILFLQHCEDIKKFDEFRGLIEGGALHSTCVFKLPTYLEHRLQVLKQ